MGRHSARDDDELDVVEAPGDVLVAAPPARGRHAAPDVDDERERAEPAADGQAADVGVAETEPLRRRRPPNADLRMLRDNPTLRTRCAAAVVVPFVLYTVALLVIGRTDVYLIWLWIPTVTAGILAGAFLDIAAKREQRADESD